MDQEIVAAVTTHYETNKSPYYLADLGNFFRLKHFDIPEGIRFKDFLASRFQGLLVVVQDPLTPAKIAIATPENEALVRQRLSNDTEYIPEDDKTNYSRLPFSLIAAFCISPPPNMDVFFRVKKPFRYEIQSQAPDDQYVVIDEEFRPTGMAGKSYNNLSSVEKQEIYAQIDRWAIAHDIDLRKLYFDYWTNTPRRTPSGRTKTRNALQRLIDAQEPELRPRIKIPGDIASKLMDLS